MQVLHYRVNFAQIVRTWPNWASCTTQGVRPSSLKQLDDDVFEVTRQQGVTDGAAQSDHLG